MELHKKIIKKYFGKTEKTNGIANSKSIWKINLLLTNQSNLDHPKMTLATSSNAISIEQGSTKTFTDY